jgi:hypothetical protein
MITVAKTICVISLVVMISGLILYSFNQLTEQENRMCINSMTILYFAAGIFLMFKEKD